MILVPPKTLCIFKFEKSSSQSHEEPINGGRVGATLACMAKSLGGVSGKTEHHRKESFSFLVQISGDVKSAKS